MSELLSLPDYVQRALNPRKGPKKKRLWTKEIVIEMKRLADSEGLTMVAAHRSMLERGLLPWNPKPTSFKSTAWKEGIRFQGKTLRASYGSLGAKTVLRLTKAAQERGITWSELAKRLLVVTCELNMIDYILDDQDA